MAPQPHDLMTSIGLLILRLGFGGYMVSHGWGKVQMVLAGDFEKFGDPLGLGSGLSLVLAMSAEFFCAILVTAGLATRFVAAPIVFTMAVAAFVVHGSDPWTMGEAFNKFMAGQTKFPLSKEPALLYLLAFLTLLLTGAGRISIDHLLRSYRRQHRHHLDETPAAAA